jgi:chaperonin GroES
MKSIQPINDNVLVKLTDSEEKKTASGLYIPDTVKEKPQQGEVVALSPDLESPLQVGDTVMFKKFSGSEVNLDDVSYILLAVGDVLGRLVDVDKIPE